LEALQNITAHGVQPIHAPINVFTGRQSARHAVCDVEARRALQAGWEVPQGALVLSLD
jgi:hypothetical protein